MLPLKYVARAHWLFPGSPCAPIQWSFTSRSLRRTAARDGSTALGGAAAMLFDAAAKEPEAPDAG